MNKAVKGKSRSAQKKSINEKKIFEIFAFVTICSTICFFYIAFSTSDAQMLQQVKQTVHSVFLHSFFLLLFRRIVLLLLHKGKKSSAHLLTVYFPSNRAHSAQSTGEEKKVSYFAAHCIHDYAFGFKEMRTHFMGSLLCVVKNYTR